MLATMPANSPTKLDLPVFKAGQKSTTTPANASRAAEYRRKLARLQRGRSSASNAQMGDAPRYSATWDAAVKCKAMQNGTIYAARLNPPRNHNCRHIPVGSG